MENIFFYLFFKAKTCCEAPASSWLAQWPVARRKMFPSLDLKTEAARV